MLDTLGGVAFERRMEELFARGGYAVTRTPASGDMGLDLILSDRRSGARIGVQLKRWDPITSRVGVRAVQEVYAGAAFYGCPQAVLITTAHVTRPARRLAEQLGVLVWDRETFSEQLRQRRMSLSL